LYTYKPSKAIPTNILDWRVVGDSTQGAFIRIELLLFILVNLGAKCNLESYTCRVIRYVRDLNPLKI